MHVSGLLSGVALLSPVFAQLNQLAKANGLTYFGTATDPSEFSNGAYASILSNINNFGQLTAVNGMKWGPTEPEQNVYDYSNGDEVVSEAQKNGQLMRCHNLVWYSQLPNWVSSGSWTNSTLVAAMQAHIQSAVTHYKGKCYCWDVVNEAFNDDGTYRSDVLYNTIGPEYIPIAFETAFQYDSSVKLYYNDYNIEYSGAKATAAQNLVSSLKSRGIKIDGVGLQGHFIVGQTPDESDQVSNLNSFTKLGVEVAYTEVDIRFSSLPPSTSGLQQQATDYVNVVSACVTVADCIGITLWDFTDEYSWIPSTFPGSGDACLWDSNLNTRPAYTSVVSYLAAAATGSGGTPTSKSSSFTTSTTRPTTTSSSGGGGGTIAEWGQCAGEGWTGSGTCVSGTTCQYSNPWYSQCLP